MWDIYVQIKQKLILYISSFFSGSLKRKKQNVESFDAGQTANKMKFDVKYDRHKPIYLN